jgi:hypothetical protein
MATAQFDILKRNKDGSFSWLEAAATLDSAKARLNELITAAHGEYFVFDQISQQIVAKLAELRGKNQGPF